ncbi:unnamed protein product [Meloidogyne enterolobii]|uniref:Uncharacterized protein n=1 Tax=Meloidogyne enterolobii TaxID=390850 RepID=A0ACB1ANM4_MELEN
MYCLKIKRIIVHIIVQREEKCAKKKNNKSKTVWVSYVVAMGVISKNTQEFADDRRYFKVLKGGRIKETNKIEK